MFTTSSGIGLARMEFIINEHIKVHPLACLKPHLLTQAERLQLETLIQGYNDPREYFVSKLAQGKESLGG